MEEEIKQEESKEPEKQEQHIDYKDAWLRVQADYQNLLKETAKKQADYARYANEELLKDLLPVAEHFSQGLKYIPAEHHKADWMIGFSQIKKMLDEFLQKQGVERIQTVGEMFNPEIHEAVANRKEEGKESGTILEEVSGGYKLNGKIVLTPKVIVAE